jgi:hypothetical protein
MHIALAIGLLWLVTGACDCDANLQQVTPRLEFYHVDMVATPPASLDQMTAIPQDDLLLVDFGQVDVGNVARRYLFLRNSGTADLDLVSAEIAPNTSPDLLIGCLDGADFLTDCAVGPQAPISITPGRDLIVEIAYAPAEAGADSGSFSLHFNVSLHQVVTVQVQATAVTPEIQVCFADCVGAESDPACAGAGELCNDQVDRDQLVVDFGDVEMEASRERLVTVRNQGELPLQVASIALAGTSHDQYSLELTGSGLPGTLAAGQEAEFTVRFEPRWGGPHTENLIIQSSDANEPEVVLILSGQGVAPRICPEPMLLDFGNVQAGVPVTQSFVLRSCGLQTLHLMDLTMAVGGSPDFSMPTPPNLPTNLQPGEQIEVQVVYNPPTAGSDSGGVDIFSNDQSADPATGLTGTVLLRGNAVEKACDIQTTPFAVNFGVVVLGDAPTMDVIIANVGTDPCTISDVAVSVNTPDNEFSLAASPGAMTLGVGELATATVQYTPVAPLGQDTGTLSVFANDKDTNEVRIDLNGFSVPPGGEGPIAVCSVTPAQSVPFQTVTWNGSQSYDTNNRPITEYRWEVFAFPPGSGATLRGVGAVRTTEVDFAGDYIASLVVVNDLGQTSDRVYCTTTVVPTQDLWIEMFWQHTGDDMDLHMLRPGGMRRTNGDCYYANCVPIMGTARLEWGQPGYTGDNPRLDRDDIPGDGPENINIADPEDGVFTVFVHDFPGSSYTPANQVTVKVYIEGVFQQQFVNSISGENSDWDVCTITWPSGVITPL